MPIKRCTHKDPNRCTNAWCRKRWIQPSQVSFFNSKKARKISSVWSMSFQVFTKEASKRTWKKAAQCRKLTCTICGENFPNKPRADYHHLKKHSLVREHVCEQCGKEYLTRGHLKHHKKKHLVVKAEKPIVLSVLKNEAGQFPCNECSKVFKSKRSAEEHVHIIHMNQIMFGCSLCNKRFTRNNSLKQHNKIHLLMENANGQNEWNQLGRKRSLNRF